MNCAKVRLPKGSVSYTTHIRPACLPARMAEDVDSEVIFVIIIVLNNHYRHHHCHCPKLNIYHHHHCHCPKLNIYHHHHCHHTNQDVHTNIIIVRT